MEHSRWQAFLRGHRVNRAAPGAEEGWNLMSDPLKSSYSTVAPVSVSYSFLCRRGIVWVDMEEQRLEIHNCKYSKRFVDHFYTNTLREHIILSFSEL